MRYSVIVDFTHKMQREYDDDDEQLTDDDDFTDAEIERNKPGFDFPGLDYTQFDDGTGCGFGSYDWAGVLGPKAMQKLAQELCLEVTDERSMGTLGAPGCGLAVVPNIICRGTHPDCDGWVDAFITPIPTEREMHKLDWEGAKEKLKALMD